MEAAVLALLFGDSNINNAQSLTITWESGAQTTILTGASLVNTDGSRVDTFFGVLPIAQAMANPDLLGMDAAAMARMMDSISFTNPEALTIIRGGTVTTGTLQGADGSRAEVRVPPPSPYGEVVWEHTEYSPTGQVISYSYGTTLRANGQHVIVSWERAVDEDGEPTGDWDPNPKVEAYDPNAPEPDELAAAQIGEIFGSQLGSLIAGSNPFVQVLAGSALATILGNIGGTISYFNGDDDGDDPGSLSDEIDDIQLPEFANFFTVLQGQAVGAVSSFLTAELGEAMGLEGLGGQLFSTIVNRSIGAVLNTVARNLFTPPKDWNGDIFANFSAEQLITNIEYGIGSLIGGYLARQIVDIDTQAAAIGANLGSAIGTFLGTSIASGFSSAIAGTAIQGTLAGIGSSFASALGIAVEVGATAVAGAELFIALGNLIIPGIGAFIGVIIGALLGSLFEKKTVPQAAGEVELNFDEGRYYLDNTFARDGGNEGLAREMSEASRDILNGYLDMIGGDNANMISPTQIYGHSGGQLYVKVDTDGDGTLDRVDVESAGEAVAVGVVNAIKGTHIEGGDIFMKRAVLNSKATTLDQLLGDLKVAEDYKRYLRAANDNLQSPPCGRPATRAA